MKILKKTAHKKKVPFGLTKRREKEYNLPENTESIY